MKVSELLEDLQKLDPDDEVCALVFAKDAYQFDEEDGLILTDEGWHNVVEEFQSMALKDIFSWMSDAVLDHADGIDDEDDEEDDE